MCKKYRSNIRSMYYENTDFHALQSKSMHIIFWFPTFLAGTTIANVYMPIN